MPILVRNIRLGLDESEDMLPEMAASRVRVPRDAIRTYAIVRRALDARKRGEIHFSYQLELVLDEPRRAQQQRIRRLGAADITWIDPQKADVPPFGKEDMRDRPVIVGFGPAGMFAALRLAQFGYRPIVLERGRDVRRRHRDVLQRFFRDRDFDPESNILYGEGGAGTYSDGKLYTRISDPRSRYVLETLYQHGAPPEILIDTRPHIGSDRLPSICARIRRKIENLGGEIRFDCQVDDIKVGEAGLEALSVRDSRKSNESAWMPVGPTILGIGHSARDTIRMLAIRGVGIEAKPFQLGVRIEHPQDSVDRWQYGAAAGHQRLGHAEYHLVAKRAAGEHGDLFSFCMCPGGTILPTNESPGLTTTNGASRASRSSGFGNSGLVITCDPKTLGLTGLSGLAYQEQWERKAFKATGGDYSVPAQRASDFLAGRGSEGKLETSHPMGAKWTTIADLIPEHVATALRHALPMLAGKFPGFAGDEGIITAPETRASSPVRITRDQTTRQAARTPSLYPVGEGAGYAGGIVSAANDGIRSADAIIERFAPPR